MNIYKAFFRAQKSIKFLQPNFLSSNVTISILNFNDYCWKYVLNIIDIQLNNMHQ